MNDLFQRTDTYQRQIFIMCHDHVSLSKQINLKMQNLSISQRLFQKESFQNYRCEIQANKNMLFLLPAENLIHKVFFIRRPAL